MHFGEPRLAADLLTPTAHLSAATSILPSVVFAAMPTKRSVGMRGTVSLARLECFHRISLLRSQPPDGSSCALRLDSGDRFPKRTTARAICALSSRQIIVVASVKCASSR